MDIWDNSLCINIFTSIMSNLSRGPLLKSSCYLSQTTVYLSHDLVLKFGWNFAFLVVDVGEKEQKSLILEIIFRNAIY